MGVEQNEHPQASEGKTETETETLCLLFAPPTLPETVGASYLTS